MRDTVDRYGISVLLIETNHSIFAGRNGYFYRLEIEKIAERFGAHRLLLFTGTNRQRLRTLPAPRYLAHEAPHLEADRGCRFSDLIVVSVSAFFSKEKKDMPRELALGENGYRGFKLYLRCAERGLLVRVA